MAESNSTSSILSLPFKRVVIYKNGVAYFEREGKIEGNCSIDLNFKPTEMNDIIRSLRVVDLEGGKIANISYDSPPPDNDNSLTNKSALSTDIFSFLIGSNVSITQDNQEKALVGRVLGTKDAVDAGVRYQSLQVLVGARILFINTSKMTSLEILDEHMKQNVNENLDSVVNEKKKDTRQVNIMCKGNGSRSVRVSYILENPIWKSNYRIHMKHGKEKNEKIFYLEGWACVDNTSEYDWNEVSLSLVSGSPISFQHEVYSPVVGIRPSQFSDEGKSAQNVVIRNNQTPGSVPSYSSMPQPPRGPRQLMNNAFDNANYISPNYQPFSQQVMQQQPMMPQNYDSPPLVAEADTETVEIGNLFHYEIQTPITVKRDHSSLVPTVSGAVKARQVCWFDPRRHAVNPMEGIMLKNTTGSILDKGPVIVTEEESYLGESLMGATLMMEESVLLAYSVNLECKVSKTSSTSEKPKHTRLEGSEFTVTYSILRNTEYTIANNSEHEIELVLDHEENIEEKIEAAKAQTKWKTGTRFYVMLPPLKKTIFNVPATTIQRNQSKSLMDYTPYSIVQFIHRREMSKAVYATFLSIYGEAVKVAKARSAIWAEIELSEQIVEEQKRIKGMTHLHTIAGALEKQIAELEEKLTKSRKVYAEKYQIWEDLRKPLLKRVEELKLMDNWESGKVEVETDPKIPSELQGVKTELKVLLSPNFENGRQVTSWRN